MAGFRIIRRLRDLLDFTLGTPSDGDVVTYDTGTGEFVLAPPAATGAPTTADYLVGTANGSLSGEIVAGTSPGGELGGSWALPTVDATHSGSSHAGVQAAAEATAAAALLAHESDATAAHAGTAIANTPAGSIAATTVQAAVNELDAEVAGRVAIYPAHAGAQSLALPPTGGLIVATILHTESPDTLIKAAKRRGFTFIWISELNAAIRGLKALPLRPILLTVDDARVECFTVVHPVVASYGVKANLMVVSDFVDGNPDGMVDASLSALTPATWANLATMRDTGLWEFQNHTRIHANMIPQVAATRRADLTACNARIVEMLGVTAPVAVAYPNGSYDVPVIQDCKTVGLSLGFDFHGGGKSGDGKLTPFGSGVFSINRANGLTAACLDDVYDTALHWWENDITGARNAANVLSYWTLSAGGSFQTSGEDIRVDNRTVAAAQETLTTDFFAVRPSDMLSYHLYSQSELQTLGNAGIKVSQYDSAKAFISDIALKSYAAAAGFTFTAGKTPLAATCRFVKLKVWCDAAYNGLVHYKNGFLTREGD